MAYLKRVLAEGTSLDVADWTPLDIASMLRETVLQASLQRTLQQAQLQYQSEPSTKALWDRWVQQLRASQAQVQQLKGN